MDGDGLGTTVLFVALKFPDEIEAVAFNDPDVVFEDPDVME